MSFKIQISNPEVLNILDVDVLSIEDAIEAIFPLETEYAFIEWNYIYIPLSYKYDISLMINDFIKIYIFLNDKNSNYLEIHWSSNTFASIWILSKESNNINIKSNWNNVLGQLKNLLNENNEILINNYDFKREIGVMIKFIKNSLDGVGYNSLNIEDWNTFPTF
ncbi:hypothetical protein [Flavobacterium marginilacus]|uniref:hypothetical protein n=1 Tax=Flavobacterium marginilacus TaxID=3003256 RepID=UPI00248DB4CF|nr:hypothetical protein [Flavobacterium marginilacus]